MSQVNVTSRQAADCLGMLRTVSGPIVASDLAQRLFLSGSRETQRRHVRAIVKQLRDDGHMIVATLQGGYALTKDAAIGREYLDGRQIDAKRILGKTHKEKRMLADRLGQGLLFRPVISGAG